MIIAHTNDGTTFQGATAANIVQQMRDTQWGQQQVKRDYIADTAERVAMLTGQPIDTTDATTFLLGLAHAGLVTLTIGAEHVIGPEVTNPDGPAVDPLCDVDERACVADGDEFVDDEDDADAGVDQF